MGVRNGTLLARKGISIEQYTTACYFGEILYDMFKMHFRNIIDPLDNFGSTSHFPRTNTDCGSLQTVAGLLWRWSRDLMGGSSWRFPFSRVWVDSASPFQFLISCPPSRLIFGWLLGLSLR